MTAKKVRVGFFDFTGCEGCQLAKVSMENELPQILEHIEIVNFREAMSEKSWDMDVAFIEGSITTPACVERINRIRQAAPILVTLGACSTIGGINAIRVGRDLDEIRQEVYGDKRYLFPSLPVMPVSAVVKVDASIYGCPPNPKDVARFLTQFLAGKIPQAPKYPVCIECKLQGNACLLVQGIPCMGVVTRAGCGAWCPSKGQFCYGCRGLIPDANLDALRISFEECGLSQQEIDNKLHLFSGRELEKLS
ncbi:MAG: NADH:ubiquinone oxidoreductase [Deltaproteobacteria bacterium]|nr:NADH:ubiquinone oxidoreductase [Deltaproteobacteria bacterium]